MGGEFCAILRETPHVLLLNGVIGPTYGDAGCGIRDRHRTGLTNMPVV